MVIGVDETGGIVVDIGSSSIKLGYGGEDVPKAVFPSVLVCSSSLLSSITDLIVRIRLHIISVRWISILVETIWISVHVSQMVEVCQLEFP